MLPEGDPAVGHSDEEPDQADVELIPPKVPDDDKDWVFLLHFLFLATFK